MSIPSTMSGSRYVYQSINGYKVVNDHSTVKCYPLNLLDQFLCPITHKVAQNPVYICSQTGQGNVYDKDAIISWFKKLECGTSVWY